MPKFRIFAKYWLFVFLWMALIFCASGDSLSFPHTSRVIGPFMMWLFPGLSDAAVHNIVVFVRKCGHLGEYAVMALLIWRALRKPQRGERRPWSWAVAGQAVLGVLIYAASDEFHQLFVPSRQASIWDVMLDTTGGALGMVALWLVWRWRNPKHE